MALLGVLLGISMAVLGWGVYELQEQKKFIIELQNTVVFDMDARIRGLEKRKTVDTAKPAEAMSHSAYAARRQWSEDAPAKDSN